MDWVAYWHDRAGMVAQFLLLKWFTVLLWMRLKIISWKIVLTEDTKLIFLFDNWFFLKRANPGLFFFSFYLFKHVTNFTTDTFGEKCPSSIRCRDSNSWPLEHEPPPITTRPGLPPKKLFEGKWYTPHKQSAPPSHNNKYTYFKIAKYSSQLVTLPVAQLTITRGLSFSDAATLALLNMPQMMDFIPAMIQRLKRRIRSIAICILSGSPSSAFLLPEEKGGSLC